MNVSFYFKMALDNIKKNLRVYVPFILSSAGIVAMYYIVSSLSNNESLYNSYAGDFVIGFLNIARWVVVIFSVIFLFYSNSFVTKRRKSELGLYNVLGLEKKHLITIVFIEHLLCMLICTGLGLLVGVIFEKLSFLILLRILGLEVTFGAITSIVALVDSIKVYASIFMMLFIYSGYQVIKANPLALLQEKHVGEKEPKAKWLWSIIGVVVMFLGYYLSITTDTAYEVILTFFPAVILVIIATYLLFTTGSIALLKVMKANKNYYYKTNHFITISNMMFRMKKNAVGLASICILSTMILVMLSSTVSLWFSLDAFASTVAPYDIMISTSPIDKSANVEEIVNKVVNAQRLMTSDIKSISRFETAATIDKDGISFENNGTKEVIVTIYVDQDGYYKITNEYLDLKDKEVVLFNYGVDYKNPDINIGDVSYKVKEVRNNRIDRFPGSDNIINDQLVVVVEDLSELQDIYNRHLAVKDIIHTDIHQYTMFDIESEYNRDNLRDDLYNGLYNLKLDYIRVDNSEEIIESFRCVYGSFLFLGAFLGIVFIIAIILIIYYKQISEGSEDRKRYEIMRRVGLSDSEIRKTINSQVLLVFFMPLIVAIIHLFGSYNLVSLVINLLSSNVVDNYLYWFSVCVLVFTVFYVLIYLLTSRVYYKIVTK